MMDGNEEEAVTDRTMQAWAVDVPGPIGTRPLTRVERAVPEPGPGQVRVRVSVCGVCRTDLHLAEGDLTPTRHLVVPGHEVVGASRRATAWASRGSPTPAGCAGTA